MEVASSFLLMPWSKSAGLLFYCCDLPAGTMPVACDAPECRSFCQHGEFAPVQLCAVTQVLYIAKGLVITGCTDTFSSLLSQAFDQTQTQA